MKPERSLTVPEAAQLLGVSRQRVQQLIRAGLIRADTVRAPARGFMYLISPREVRRRVRHMRALRKAKPARGGSSR